MLVQCSRCNFEQEVPLDFDIDFAECPECNWPGRWIVIDINGVF